MMRKIIENFNTHNLCTLSKRRILLSKNNGIKNSTTKRGARRVTSSS